MSEKPLRDTKLGEWLKEKAPNVLEVAGDLLPDRGVLGIVKNMVGDDPEAKALIQDAEKAAQEAVTRRWQADMGSDTKLAKIIRPAALISLLGLYLVLVVADSITSLPFEVKGSYLDLLEVLSLTSFGAYFAGRTIEKSKR